jgi:hypothetical protein
VYCLQAEQAWRVGRSAAAAEAVERLHRIDAEIGLLEGNLDRAYAFLREGPDRRASQRIRSVSSDLARQRMNACRHEIIRLFGEELEAEAAVEAEDETVTALLTSPIRELFQDLVPEEQLQETARKKVKSRYTCPHCHTNVWGKPSLKLLCGECGTAYEEIMAA